MSDIRCDIRQKLGVLSENERGYTKEANVISWNDGPQKLDLREWSPEHRARKGISLNDNEARTLYLILDKIYGGQR